MRKAEALLGQRQATLHRTKTQLIKKNVKDAAVIAKKSKALNSKDNKKEKLPTSTFYGKLKADDTSDVEENNVNSSDEYDTDLEYEGIFIII